MSEFLEAALAYADLGLSVIPVRGKKPYFDNWPEAATADRETIRRWWIQNPHDNIGIATGSKGGVFVLDVDIKSGGRETYETLRTRHGFPETWQSITGSGGSHLYFRYPNFPVANAAGIYPGIDIRGDGGQVVAPPSVHRIRSAPTSGTGWMTLAALILQTLRFGCSTSWSINPKPASMPRR